MRSSFGRGGFGIDENEWAEKVAQSLDNILTRMDGREEKYGELRDNIKHFLSGFEYNEDDKLVLIDKNTPVPFHVLMDIIEGFYPAVPTAWWSLIDLVVERVTEINSIMEQITLDETLRLELQAQVKLWLQKGIYEVGKITTTKLEDRESDIRKSVLLLAQDATPLLRRGDVGHETRRAVSAEADTRKFREDEDVDLDNEEDDESY